METLDAGFEGLAESGQPYEDVRQTACKSTSRLVTIYGVDDRILTNSLAALTKH
jgi:hypothetical protein